MLLIGMMGAGKSTVGRRLAASLGAAFLDSDEQVEAATGRTVPEILRTDGEAAFRAEESAALERALATAPPLVISVAGGAVLDPANRRRMSTAGTVVWLRAKPSTLTRRVGDGKGRPLLEGDVGRNIERLESVRRPLYAEIADVVVDVDELTPDEVVSRVAAAVGGRAA